MNWEIDHIDDGNIMRVKLFGSVDLEQTKQICMELISAAEAHQSRRCLFDHRGVEIVLPVSDIDGLPDALRKFGANFAGKTALLLDPSPQKGERFEFLKDVLAKAWMHLELFTDEDKAIAWLKTI